MTKTKQIIMILATAAITFAMLKNGRARGIDSCKGFMERASKYAYGAEGNAFGAQAGYQASQTWATMYLACRESERAAQ